jgi:hypothetical protein
MMPIVGLGPPIGCAFSLSLFLAGFLLSHGAQADVIVWDGAMNYAFSKPSGVDWNLPIHQDRLMDDIRLTRANTQGLFNIAQEASFQPSTSPGGTLWATEFMPQNDGLNIAASNWQQLTFASWAGAYGATSNLLANILNGNAVVHLTSGGDDIFLNFRFTEWQSSFGGAFTYLRSVPEPLSALLLSIGLLGCAVLRRRPRTALSSIGPGFVSAGDSAL